MHSSKKITRIHKKRVNSVYTILLAFKFRCPLYCIRMVLHNLTGTRQFWNWKGGLVRNEINRGKPNKTKQRSLIVKL